MARKKDVVIGRGMKVKRGAEEKMKSKPGGSSVGKYKNVKKKDFAGPSGKAPQGSFPIPDIAHGRNALARSHFAPSPEGIRRAVYKKFPELKKRHMEREAGHKPLCKNCKKKKNE